MRPPGLVVDLERPLARELAVCALLVLTERKAVRTLLLAEEQVVDGRVDLGVVCS